MNPSMTLSQALKDFDVFGGPEEAVMNLVRRRSDVTNELIIAALGLTVWAHRFGHPCVNLDNIRDLIATEVDEETLINLEAFIPPVEEFISALKSSPELVRVVEEKKLAHSVRRNLTSVH